MKKRLPVGVENYVIAQQYYFVDKTLFIKDLIDGYLGKSLLITRPRRFGKTLMMSMVDCYFDINQDNADAFMDKKIYKAGDKYLSFLHSIPVIHINMKNVRGKTREEIIAKTKNEIAMLYRKHDYLLHSDSLYESDIQAMEDIISGKEDRDYIYEQALYKLSSYLYFHFHKQVIILIDEYDTPLESAFENNLYDECIDFFKELYSSSLKGNDFIILSICTGVLEISKESLFSGLNNLEVCSIINDDLSNYFGFNKEEIMDMISYYGCDVTIDDLTLWYGGYYVGHDELYNPWSIINYFKNNSLSPYWVNSGSNSLIDTILTEDSRKDLISVLSSETTVSFNTAINYRDLLDEETAIYSYLVHAGYLTMKDMGNNTYQLNVVNREIREMFEKDIIGRNINKPHLLLAEQLRNAFVQGDINDISRVLEEYILVSYSYMNLTKEKDFQNMLTGLLAVLFEEYVVKSEVTSKLGRCDIMISPKKEHDLGIVIELKHYDYQLSKKNLKTKVDLAIGQIEKHRYYQELQQRNCSRIILYGFVFDKKRHLLEMKDVKANFKM